MEVEYQVLLEKARELTKSGTAWHHHYLPSDCLLIDVEKHVIVLESGNKKWQTIIVFSHLQNFVRLKPQLPILKIFRMRGTN